MLKHSQLGSFISLCLRALMLATESAPPGRVAMAGDYCRSLRSMNSSPSPVQKILKLAAMLPVETWSSEHFELFATVKRLDTVIQCF